ncbi:MAG: cation-translocating P-type ATPase [Armatimonadota bacterium]
MEAIATIDIARFRGLSEEEAERRLREEGPNELPLARPRSLFAIALQVVREPMFILLIAGAAIYLLLGDLQEGLLLLGFVVVVVGITFHQERRTENALKALQDLSSPRARVIRSGQQRRVAGREVARGDIVIVSEGDRIPADGIVRDASNLSVDESLLTGESAPVRKQPWHNGATTGRPGGDDEPFVYSSTLVVQGLAVMEVQRTGINTEIGKIGRSLQSLKVEKTSLQTQTTRIVRTLAIIGVSLSAALAVIYALTVGNWLEGLLAGVALAMALLPEEFPVVLTIFLALGAWRLSRQQVLARRIPAVETLGAATVLCVDKTGTLTLNQMTVGELRVWEDVLVVDSDEDVHKCRLPEMFHPLVEFSILASQRDPFDPMEKAFHTFGNGCLAYTEHLHGDWELVREYPLSPDLLAMSHVWRSTTGPEYVVAAKGAPEAIADICHLSVAQQYALAADIGAMAERGLRVLGVARSHFTETDILPPHQHVFDFTLLGLIGLIDPLRPAVPAAISECYNAGIRVVMITGDYPATARNIARQIGLHAPDHVIAGDELAALEEDQFHERLGEVNIFARMVPEQKLRLVQALRAQEHVVAMTGDGVNDAPALKAANIGVAMGGRGTDVAREAAGLVILDDDFTSIVAAVRLGRRIFDNLRKAMAYILSIHVPIAGLSLIPALLHWPLILSPVHIVLMELVIDPACSTVFEAEPEEGNVMRRPPRPAAENIFNRRTIILSLLQGLNMLFVCLMVFLLARRLDLPGMDPATMAFTTLLVGNIALIMTNLSWTQGPLAILQCGNRPLWWVLGGVATLLLALLYVPALSDLFELTRLSLPALSLCLLSGVAGILWFEIWKRVHVNHMRAAAS